MKPTGEPTSEELRLAERWVRLRSLAAQSYESHLDAALRDAIREICRIVWRHTGSRVNGLTFSFGMDRGMLAEIEAVLRALSELLAGYTEDIVSAADDDTSNNLFLWLSNQSDVSVAERFSTIVTRWSLETESLMAAAMLDGLGETETADAVAGAMYNPWESDIWCDALEKGGSGASASILAAGGISYGKGHTNVGERMLLLLGDGLIGTAYAEQNLRNHEGAAWFMSLVADENACRDCFAEMEQGWQPISSYRGEWHPRCRCRFVFRKDKD